MNSGSVAMPIGDAPSLPRALVPALVAVALLVAGMLLAHTARPALSRPVQWLRVDGALKHLQPAQIAAAAAIVPGTGLLDVDLAAARQRIGALPWVGRVRVSRVWPAGIEIAVAERQAVARWDHGSLVDADGAVFSPPAADLPPGLPQLSGPDGRAPEVERVYRELGAALKDSPFVPAGLELSSRGEWTLHTTGGVEIRLGDQAPQARVGLILGVVTRTLADRLGQVAYIDLRYTNGFAVGPAAAAAATPGSRAAAGRGSAAAPAVPSTVPAAAPPPAVPGRSTAKETRTHE
ncbi:MAG: cell division protein FtsQ/DivIB [Nevskia sp.]|nr:cell division protein FtsQ/DivIB [Nevskia sp.]